MKIIESNSTFRLFLTTACLLLTTAVFGQSNAINPKEPICNIMSIPYLLGQVALSLGSGKTIENTMPCLLKLWEQQIPGTPNAENKLSNGFLFVMEENPQSFFSIVATQPKFFSDWLRELPKVSFVQADSNSCQLETKRLQLLNLVERVHFSRKEEIEISNSLVKTLSEIPPHRACE